MYKNFLFTLIMSFSFLFVSGCKFSPLSPNGPNINGGSGDIGDIKNNQNGILADISAIRNQLDILAGDIENLQNGFINSNTKNTGVTLFQGDGGLIVGLVVLSLLIFLIYDYRKKALEYKKTAEVMGKEIKALHNKDLEESVLISALGAKVETKAYEFLRDD